MKKITLVTTALLTAMAINNAVFAGPTYPTLDPTYTMTVTNNGMEKFFMTGAPTDGSFFASFQPSALAQKYKASCSPIACSTVMQDGDPIYITTSEISYGQSEIFSVAVAKGMYPDVIAIGVDLYTSKEPNGFYYLSNFLADYGNDPLPQNMSINTGDSGDQYYRSACDSQSPVGPTIGDC